MKKLSLKKSLLLLASGMLVLSSCGGTKKMVKIEETPAKPALMPKLTSAVLIRKIPLIIIYRR